MLSSTFRARLMASGALLVAIGLLPAEGRAQLAEWSITNGGVGDFAGWAASLDVQPLPGDYNADGRTDIALVRRNGGWATVPVAFAQGNGGWSITNAGVGDFAGWAASADVLPLAADFNADGRTDIALLRRTAGWSTIPVAFAQGNGNWSITNGGVGDFAAWAASSDVLPIVGDFNADRRADIALVRQTGGWATIPIAFGQGNGTWSITNAAVGDFAGWAATSEVLPWPGDFNADGRTDIALVRRSGGWGTMPVAFAQGNGTWSITNGAVGDFAGWAASTDVWPLGGDFNGDGRTDLALLRRNGGWATVPVAFAQGNGGWSITNGSVGHFAGWAATTDVLPIVGDYNRDGRADIALVRRNGGWATVPVAFAQGNGGWSIENRGVGDYAGWAASTDVIPLPGDYNADRRTDIALLRRATGWATIPVAFATELVPPVVRDFNVRRFTTTALTNADADRILGDATTVLQQNDGPGDVPSNVLLRRTGAVTAFADGDGSIDSAAEFNALMALPGNIKAVNAINWCGGLIPNVIGCAPVPGNSLAIVRFTADLEGILWAHELGHNRGLGHRNDDANAVMNGTIGPTRRRLNAAEDLAFRTAPATAAVAMASPQPAAGPVEAVAVQATDAANPQNVRAFVRQVFVHGVPYEDASRFGAAAVPELVAMLQDPTEEPWWANIVVTLGMIGDPAAVEPMIAFIERAGADQARARNAAVMSLGYIVNTSGDPRALDYLAGGARPTAWRERSAPGIAAEAAAGERVNELSKYAILGLALSGRPEAADALRRLQGPAAAAELAPSAGDLLGDALAENAKVREQGLAGYYRSAQR